MSFDPIMQEIKMRYRDAKRLRPNRFHREGGGYLSDLSGWVRRETLDYIPNRTTYNKNWRRTMVGAGATTVCYFVSPVLSVPLFLYTVTKAYQTHKDKQIGGG